MRYAASMPIPMETWYSAPTRPRTRAGANSERYIGASTDAIPTPTPPSARAMIRRRNDSGIAE